MCYFNQLNTRLWGWNLACLLLDSSMFVYMLPLSLYPVPGRDPGSFTRNGANKEPIKDTVCLKTTKW